MKKKKVLIINIPEPCHENWEEMTQVDKGRHCKVCDKCVIDFSNFSAQDLIQYFQNKPVNVCGRFHNFQLGLNQFEMLPVRNRSSWPLVASLFS